MMYKNGKICKADGTVVSETLGSIIPSQVDKVYDATRTFDKACRGCASVKAKNILSL